MVTVPTVDECFRVGGLLATALRGFNPRPPQREMARSVAETLQDRGVLVAEAGTGTGKTLAYLIPAILSEQKVVISTATKTLQDQLFRKDLPSIRKALGKPFRAALLKGRGNYICLYRAQNHLGLRAGQGLRDARIIEGIRRFAKTTLSGDIAEAFEVPEQTPLWTYATSTADNCLGADCPKYSDCFLVKARSRAREADLVVVNHHLLWADWTLRNDGLGELLPSSDAIIIDEAHQLMGSAEQFLGTSITSRQLIDLSQDLISERVREAPEAIDLQEEAERLGRLTDDVRISMGEGSRREPWHVLDRSPQFEQAFAELHRHLGHLGRLLEGHPSRGKGLEQCQKRVRELEAQMGRFLEADSEATVRWFETRKNSFLLSRTPLEIAEEFSKFRADRACAWIFTSATLTVAQRFDHFNRSLGLISPRCQSWESPFDYQRNCLLYLPQGLPEPSDRTYTESIVTAALPILKASRGRAFMLFTSHAALQLASQLLAQRISYPLYVQGDRPKSQLLDAFKTSMNGILLGTQTFWEGVDVQGPALSLVIIDKLPFAAPGDPVLAARLESLRQRGINPFSAHQLPEAIINLKQGVGRLIRDAKDRGVLMLCDPRLMSKPYGKLFLKSLPQIPLTRDPDQAMAFFYPDKL